MTKGAIRRRRLLAWGAGTAVVVLGVALALSYRPWLSPWWPGRHEAVALPVACPPLPGLPAAGMPTRSTGPGDVDGADCAWGVADGFPPLDARYSLYRRAGNSSGTEEAEHEAASRVTRYLGPEAGFTLGADTPVSGVGDEARISAHGSLVILVTRKSNVVLTVSRTSSGDVEKDQTRTAVASYARTLLDLVDLS